MVKQVFPALDVVGWYSTTVNLDIHRQIATLVENPVFLLFASADGLPITAYESSLDGGIAKVDYIVETGEAERIAVDGAAKGMEEDQGVYGLTRLTLSRPLYVTS